jgi:hypothetical protein
MSADSLHFAGVVLITVPAIAFGGARLLSAIYPREPRLPRQPGASEPVAGGSCPRRRARAAHPRRTAARRSGGSHRWAGMAGPLRARRGAGLMPLGFFLSVASPRAETPNNLIYLVSLGGISLSVGAVILGIGLLSA